MFRIFKFLVKMKSITKGSKLLKENLNKGCLTL